LRSGFQAVKPAWTGAFAPSAALAGLFRTSKPRMSVRANMGSNTKEKNLLSVIVIPFLVIWKLIHFQNNDWDGLVLHIVR
jgi:hypothetical protein